MNPELVRLLWLEVNALRLWVIPAALLATATIMHQYDAPASFARSAAMFAFLAITGLWGARQARSAVVDEVRERTWAIQRMSALDPWTMTWGKLAGAVAMPWYAGAFCLAIYLGYGAAAAPAELLFTAALASLAALGLQGLALTAALVRVHAERRTRRRLGELALVLLLGLLLPKLGSLAAGALAPLGGTADGLVFYGAVYPGRPFALVLATVLVGWVLLAAWRMMSLELDVRSTPWALGLFIVFLAVLFAGLTDGGPTPALPRRLCSEGAFWACVLAYVVGFTFARDPMHYRRALVALSQRRFRRALEEIPLVVSAALAALVLGLASALIGADPLITNERSDNLGAVALAFALVMLRDLALLLFFSFRDQGRPAETTALIWIATLNWILPSLFGVLGMPAVARLASPVGFDAPAGAVAMALLHAVVAVPLAVTAWRRAMRPLSRPGDRRS
ncbi:MAG: hypothetical protein ACU85V_08600 [Gammaproteobacteria bacterium]